MESKIYQNHIVLLEPEIPQNTGNIARSCAATNTHLHLIYPLGFQIDDKQLRRAGMDYWYEVPIHHYQNWKDFLEKTGQSEKLNDYFFLLSTKAPNDYSQKDFKGDCWFLFGKESAGIPEGLLTVNKEKTIRIPMKAQSRSLNLSNSVAIILYEALRQQNFNDLVSIGKFGQK